MGLKLAKSASFGFYGERPWCRGPENHLRVNNQPLVFVSKSHVLFLCLLVYGPQRYWPSSWITPHSVS